MSTTAVVLPEIESPISAFPKEMTDYISKNPITIKIVPDDINSDYVINAENFVIKTADDFYNYLVAERDFWTEKDEKNKLASINQKSRITDAISKFESAKGYYKTKNYNAESTLKRSISSISSGTLYSKTNLAEFILNHKDKKEKFISGLRQGLLKSPTYLSTVYVDELEGLIESFNYRKGILEIKYIFESDLNKAKENIDYINSRYTDLSDRFNKSFNEADKHIQSIKDQTNIHLNEMDAKSSKYFDDANMRLTALENLYEEKLKLEAPADYWNDLDTKYKKDGYFWLVASTLLTGIIMWLLTCIFNKLPSDVSADTNWMLVFKTTASITVITSIAVYILRLFVKMATSSFHLSRDARERAKLSYFYLSLIEKKAITDNERAIVLNSLFSRADTGLLKGDSTPVMSGNVTDLVNSLKK